MADFYFPSCIEVEIEDAAKKLTDNVHTNHSWSLSLPGLRPRVIDFLKTTRTALFPGLYNESSGDKDIERIVRRSLRTASMQLSEMLEDLDPKLNADGIARDFIKSLPEIAELIGTDVQAAYEGDPAALDTYIIMLCYPAFEAISIYRLAHKLVELGVPLIPRIMTEYAHSKTGIDIHPGATIGRYFFIDHGTGVVIGETCTIGEHVKLYQGVTLGAKSFELDENGLPVKHGKRHPDVGNNVIIYSGATILGGNTKIGDNCVIGGNVWLTHSVEAGKTIFYEVGKQE